jgi:hypothetical protein
MRHHLSVLTVVLTVAASRAAVYEVTADWLDSHALAVHAGDQARILGTEAQRAVNLDNLTWDGGQLTLVGCRLEPAPGRTPPQLPMVVAAGQTLTLQQTWIQGADTALVVAGGAAVLEDVTLASVAANIQSTSPSSHLELRNVNFCNATVGLDVQAADSVLIEGGLFLTNGTGLRCAGGAHISLLDCLFQGNEKAIVIPPDGTAPSFLSAVDLVEARYALVENLSLATVDLADSHVDEPIQLLGFWTRSGVDPGVPVHPLLQTVAPTIDDDDFIDVDLPLTSQTANSNIPCKPSVYTLYISQHPYQGFSIAQKLVPGTTFTVSTGAIQSKFLYITCSIGEWN